jgi:hypothetical protein
VAVSLSACRACSSPVLPPSRSSRCWSRDWPAPWDVLHLHRRAHPSHDRYGDDRARPRRAVARVGARPAPGSGPSPTRSWWAWWSTGCCRSRGSPTCRSVGSPRIGVLVVGPRCSASGIAVNIAWHGGPVRATRSCSVLGGPVSGSPSCGDPRRRRAHHRRAPGGRWDQTLAIAVLLGPRSRARSGCSRRSAWPCRPRPRRRFVPRATAPDGALVRGLIDRPTGEWDARPEVVG